MIGLAPLARGQTVPDAPIQTPLAAPGSVYPDAPSAVLLASNAEADLMDSTPRRWNKKLLPLASAL